MALDFIFRLVLCSRADVSFNILSEYLGRYQTVILLVNVVQKYRLEMLKSDNVKALIKTSNCKNLVLNFSKKNSAICSICCACLVFSDQTSA